MSGSDRRSDFIRPRLLDISSPYQSTTPGEFTVNLDTPIEKIIRYEVDSVSAYGVPTTGGEPDYDFFAIGIQQINFGTIATDGNSGRLKLYLDGAHTIYSPTEAVFKDTTTPESIFQVQVTVRKPDGKIASSSDLSAVHIRIRVYTDTAVRRINTYTNFKERGQL